MPWWRKKNVPAHTAPIPLTRRKTAITRQKEAEKKFMEYDTDGSNSIEPHELNLLMRELLAQRGVRFREATLSNYITAEFGRADTNQDGKLEFDEFVTYYNEFLDRNQQGIASGIQEVTDTGDELLASVCRRCQINPDLHSPLVDGSGSSLVDDEVGVLMAALVEKGSQVSRLYLQDNKITDIGAEHIAAALPRLRQLRWLRVQENAGMTKIGRSSIWKAAGPLNLEELNLGGDAEDGDSKMRAHFQRWDIDGDGLISFEEFKTAVAGMGAAAADESLLKEIFSSGDADASGTIDYVEFVALTKDWR